MIEKSRKKIITEILFVSVFVAFAIISLIILINSSIVLIKNNYMIDSFWTKDRLIICIIVSGLVFLISGFFTALKTLKLIKSLKSK